MGQVTIKEVFPVTITYKISETNSSVHVKERIPGRV